MRMGGQQKAAGARRRRRQGSNGCECVLVLRSFSRGAPSLSRSSCPADDLRRYRARVAAVGRLTSWVDAGMIAPGDALKVLRVVVNEQ